MTFYLFCKYLTQQLHDFYELTKTTDNILYLSFPLDVFDELVTKPCLSIS